MESLEDRVCNAGEKELERTVVLRLRVREVWFLRRLCLGEVDPDDPGKDSMGEGLSGVMSLVLTIIERQKEERQRDLWG